VLGRFPAPPDVTFVCGANRFVGSVAELLVAQGLDAPSIRTERFGGT
jgi:ferredoxin-NADP reductase